MTVARPMMLLAALALLAPGRVAARTPWDLLQQGIMSFDLGRLDEARRTLSRARAATRHPGLLSRIHLYQGFIAAVLGDLAAARRELATALEQDPDLVLDQTKLGAELVRLFRQVRATLSGQLLVQTRPPGSTVRVDGQDRGTTPLRVRLGVGTHRVEVRSASGVITRRLHVTLSPGRVTPLKLMMGQEGDDSSTDRPSSRQDPFPDRPRRIWTWVAAGMAAAALAVGVGLKVNADVGYNDWEVNCAGSQTPTCSEIQRDVEAQEQAMNIMWGVAGAMAAASIVLYFIEGLTSCSSPGCEDGRPPRRRAGVRLVTRAGAGLLQVSF